jgi:hypothetical protein
MGHDDGQGSSGRRVTDVREQVREWPVERVLLWMAAGDGQLVELSWNEDGNGWVCRWSVRRGTVVGKGPSPHAAVIDAAVIGFDLAEGSVTK